MLKLNHMTEAFMGTYLLWLIVTYSLLLYFFFFFFAYKVVLIINCSSTENNKMFSSDSIHSTCICSGIHMVKFSYSLGKSEIYLEHLSRFSTPAHSTPVHFLKHSPHPEHPIYCPSTQHCHRETRFEETWPDPTNHRSQQLPNHQFIRTRT